MKKNEPKKSYTDRKKRTQARSFGSSYRCNHRSDGFYQMPLFAEFLSADTSGELKESALPKASENQLFCQSSQRMGQLPEGSVHLIVTSPPYNIEKDYDQHLTLSDYRGFLKSVFQEAYRVLAPGGRLCVNIANLGRRPYMPLHAFLIADLLSLGFLMRGEIIWDKGPSCGISTAWGSWMSPANPTLRDTHEYILIFSKGSFRRLANDQAATIQKAEFLAFTKSVWTFRSVSAQSVGHPSPFPEELPYRLIQLYTFENDVVLDPFCGSGTTCVAALKTGRRYVGYEVEQTYIDLAQRRLSKIKRK